jgi:tRNA threonylcarbamoyladenosine biosynthesis protein TsaE
MNIQEMKAFAAEFLKQLEPNSANATVIGLRGELGAGKTTFTQACADLLGISETVTSPTFVILKKYKLNGKILGDKFSFLIHIDAYRLKGGKELDAIGWQGIISDPKNLIMIEWPELVADVMPANTRYIDFKHIDESTREITT